MNCSSCGIELSSTSHFCPMCGKQQNVGQTETKSIASTKSTSGPVVAFFFLIITGWLFSECTNKSGPSTASLDAQLAEVNRITTWNYSESKDEMTSTIVNLAYIQSTNEVDFKFPYNGNQRMTLSLRKNKKTDAMIIIKKGQFLCHIGEDCYVKFRFDEAQPETFEVGLPADHSTTVLFISNPGRLIAKLKKARKTKIEAPFFQEGANVFEFNTESLIWK